MQFSEKRNLTRWIIIISSFLIASLILWNTYVFFQTFKEEERNKMELWAKAQKTLMNSDVDTEIELPSFMILETSLGMDESLIEISLKRYQSNLFFINNILKYI